VKQYNSVDDRKEEGFAAEQREKNYGLTVGDMQETTE
jgi:hypothetical protein